VEFDLKDETWGAIAWWVATILKWAFWIVVVLIGLQLAYIGIGGHRPIWSAFRN
jgi:hypothetical protein